MPIGIEDARAGLPVFPVRPDKTPLTEHGFKDASVDEATIRGWWSRWPDAGIGMPTGKVSGVVVLDIDPRNGGDKSFEQLLAEHGSLPRSPVVRTGGGGEHRWFKHPGGTVTPAHGFRPGLDLQGDGSYVVVPPSPHASGKRYEWLVGHDIGLRLVPPWLLIMAGATRTGTTQTDTTHPKFEAGQNGKIPSGRRHDYMISLAASIISRTPGITEAQALAIVKPAMDAATDDDQWPTRARDIEHAVRSAISKFGRPAPPDDWSAAKKFGGGPSTEAAPPLEQFDAENGEVFRAVADDGREDLGVAWVADGRIHRTTVGAELKRITKAYEGETDKESLREEQEAVGALLSSLPFPRIKNAIWPLPEDPTEISVAEWEQANGPLLDRLVQYFADRAVFADPDAPLVAALDSMAASVRSADSDYAPRLLFEAPFGWGKSTAAEAVQLVVLRGVHGAVLSPASVHRMMNDWHPVLVIDESAIGDNPELQRVIRAGFKRGVLIVRAAQDKDRGVVTTDPYGYMILTTQVDTREDVVSRCWSLALVPGRPTRRVSRRDPEARELRTVLCRLRLDVLAGAEYRDFGAVAELAYAREGLEPRSRDKLTALWPFAVRYGVEERLVAAAARAEQRATEQLAVGDKGIVVAALEDFLKESGGPERLKAGMLTLSVIHSHVERVLRDMGEVVVVGSGEFARTQVDARKYSARDFTGRHLREMGFRMSVVEGRARLRLAQFLSLWPSVRVRYGLAPGIAESGDGGILPQNIPTTPTVGPVPPSVTAPQQTPLRDPYLPLRDPYETVGAVGIKGGGEAPPQSGPEVSGSHGRERHPNCPLCKDPTVHHVCDGCPACRYWEAHGEERGT